MRQPSIFPRKWYWSNSQQIAIIDFLSIAAISGYQRYLSPYKGFRCAHRVLYEGESCSQYVKRKVQEEGLIAALQSSRIRFIECAEANQIIQSRQQDYLISISSDVNLEIEYKSSKKPPKKKPHFLRGTKGRKNKATSAAPKNYPRNRLNWSCLEDSCACIGGLLVGATGR
jgi:putative component of membrane protein insertase Oxa1/YidC/SpoIIIJ protein YidD